jgi:hypothetical protein
LSGQQESGFGWKGLKFDRSWQNTVVYAGFAINAFLLFNLLMKPVHKIDEATGLEDLGYFFGYLGTAAFAALVAVVCWFMFDKDVPEMKWGGRFLATVLPLAGLVMVLFFRI